MGHLFKLGIENFRLFKEMTEFDLAPVTLLTGTNSSGKSSLIKSVLLLKDSFKSNDKLSKLLFTENKSNLGSYSQCLNDQNKEQQFIKFRTTVPFNCFDAVLYLDLVFIPHPYFKENGILKSFCLFNEEKVVLEFNNYVKIQDVYTDQRMIDHHEINNPTEKILSLKIDLSYFSDFLTKCKKQYAESERLKRSFEKPLPSDELSLKENVLDVDWFSQEYQEKHQAEHDVMINKMNSVFNSFHYWQKRCIDTNNKPEINISEPIVLIIDKKTKEVIVDKKLHAILDKGLTSFKNKTNFLFWEADDTPQNTLDWFLFDDLISSINFQLKLGDEYDLVFSDYGNFVFNDFLKTQIKKVFSEISSSFTNVYSLSSLRANTERLYYNTSDIVDINSLIIDFMAVNTKYNWRITGFISESLQLFNLGGSISIERHEGVASAIFINKDNKKILLADLGFGFTQLLPVIMKIAIIADEKMRQEPGGYSTGFLPSVLILEEPESNLHPSYQSKLADLIVNAAHSFNIQFIIETHSEYLIRKFQYLTAKKTLKPADISLFYFYEPDNIPHGEKQVKKIEIQEDGSLSSDFGTGFFDEALNLEFELLKIKNKN